MINIKYLTPMPSLIFLGILSIVFVIFGNLASLIYFAAFAETIVVTMAVAGLVYLRFTRPNIPRPIKVYFIHIIKTLIKTFLDEHTYSNFIYSYKSLHFNYPVYTFRI